MERKTISCNFLVFCLVSSILIIVVYSISSIGLSSIYSNIPNFLIFIFALFLLYVNLYSIKQKGIELHNIFGSVYFAVLLLNTLNLSKSQFPKEYIDIYFYFIGALFFILFLYLGDNVKFKRISNTHVSFINVNKCIWIFWCIYLVLKIVIWRKVGYALLTVENTRYINGSDFTVSGVSGISFVIMWMLLMLFPNYYNKKIKSIIIISFIIFESILNVNRGNIIRIFLYLAFLFLLERKVSHKVIDKKTIIMLSITCFLIFLAFSVFGNYRQTSGGNFFSVKLFLNGRVDNDILNWIYAYTAINFDVLKLYYNVSPLYIPTQIMMPFIRLINNYINIESYYSYFSNIGIGGMNASTFLSDTIRDFGMLYFIELIPMAFIIGIISNFGKKKKKFIGIRAFLFMNISVMIFGNYLFSPSYFFSLIAGIMINLVVKESIY